MSIDFTPSEYARFCLITDVRDGKPHVAYVPGRQITIAQADPRLAAGAVEVL